MKDEINQTKGVRIYCIYFENKEYSFNSTDDPTNILKRISELGGTNGNFYSASSLSSLFQAFTDVSNAIEINFKLAFSKKNQ